jgi:transforming growth factor-beta-induced protein
MLRMLTSPSSPLLSLNLPLQAFAALLATLNTSAADLLGKTDLLTQVLSYHIIPSVIRSADIPNGATAVTTLEGSNVTVVKTGNRVTVNGARVIRADVAAGLSVVHVIDAVLVPPPPPPPATIASVAAGVPALSTLLAAVSASRTILAAATDPTTAVTVFAPTNGVSDPTAM